MRWWARQLGRKPVAWLVVVLSLAVAAASGWLARRVARDDDVLAFLPKGNPDVGLFYDINRAFGGLDVAIVGIEVTDPFAGAFLAKLRAVTKALDDEPVIARALSLANVENFSPDLEHGGIRADYLVREIPHSDAERTALRARVMAQEHIVGNLISADATAVNLYAFGRHGVGPRQLAGLVRERVERAFPAHTKYWGGAPFTSTYIYDITQSDMRRLIPWAVLVIVLLVVASFRDVLGALLALVSTAMGIAITYGLMGLSGVDANIVLSSMPVILFAVGSAYGVHVLVRYYAHAADHPPAVAVERAIAEIGPTVVAAGLTTVAGLFSFMLMDIEPMRHFGLFTGLGIGATLILALTFVPAVIRLTGLRGRPPKGGLLEALSARLCGGARARRWPLLVVCGVLGLMAAVFVSRVDARMDNASFFARGSPPDRAEQFLRDKFGGSQFIQVLVEGDMNDPGVLRELQHVADLIAVLPHVSSVTHAAQVLSLVNEAMAGERRLPMTTAQARTLYRLLAGRPSVKQLVADDRRRALIHAKIDSDDFEVVDALLEKVEAVVAQQAVGRYRIVGRLPASAEAGLLGHVGDAPAPSPGAGGGGGRPPVPASVVSLAAADGGALRARRRQLVEARLAAVLRRFGLGLSPAASKGLIEQLAAARPAVQEADAVRKQLEAFLRSDESLLEPEQYPLAPIIARQLVALGPRPATAALTAALRRALAPAVGADASSTGGAPATNDEAAAALDGLVSDLAASLATPVDEIWRQQAAGARARSLLARLDVASPAGERGARLRAAVAGALLDLDATAGLLPDASGTDGQLTLTVSGVPVLHRGLSQSVTANQLRSLGSALGLVLLIMMVLFRSPVRGLLAAVPTAFTLLLIYGAMGAAGLHLDIGTSMLASIIIGAGVDYAVHLLAAWRADARAEGSAIEAAKRAAQHAGPAIWTNALMVAAGFFVLTLGDAKPLKNVGGLTAAAMLTAALATFLLLPALARAGRPSPRPSPQGADE